MYIYQLTCTYFPEESLDTAINVENYHPHEPLMPAYERNESCPSARHVGFNLPGVSGYFPSASCKPGSLPSPHSDDYSSTGSIVTENHPMDYHNFIMPSVSLGTDLEEDTCCKALYSLPEEGGRRQFNHQQSNMTTDSGVADDWGKPFGNNMKF